jgi:hypothetical protein
LNKVDKGISLERKPGSSANRKIDQKTKDLIIEQNVNEVGRSYRSIGRKHKIHHKSTEKILLEVGAERKIRKKAKKSNEKKYDRKKLRKVEKKFTEALK